MSGRPWDAWIPGVLNASQLGELVGQYIGGVQDKDKQIALSAIDLTISVEKAYVLPYGSVKPSKDVGYEYDLQTKKLAEVLNPEADGSYKLEKQRTYVFKLNETLKPPAGGWKIFGEATAKSTIGRVDVLARLIVDNMDVYDTYEPSHGSGGGNIYMYVEITPITFNVIVKPGISVNQLRLFYGNPKESIATGEEVCRCVIANYEDGSNIGKLSLDLTPAAGFDDGLCAFVARKAEEEYIPLWQVADGEAYSTPECRAHWEAVNIQANQNDDRLQIRKGKFYIMRSKERINVPDGIAVYCKAIDESIGEMRIHYAGFAHPYFGVHGRKDKPAGAPLVFEVRGHDVDVNLKHGEIMAELIFYRMSKACEKPKKPTSYSEQEVELSKVFSKWQSQ